jgi:hypothetical protein
MAVFQLDPKRRVRQEFLHDTGKFERIFLGHGLSLSTKPSNLRAQA